MPAGEADARSAIPQAALVGEALKAVEAASDRYLQVADLTSDEEVVWAAQNLSKAAIRRLVLLRELSPTAFEDAP